MSNKKNIGILHYVLGGTDGVSLEIDKWAQVLESMGHKVHLCAGELGVLEGTHIQELLHHRPDIKRLSHNTFIKLADYPSESEYRADLDHLVDNLSHKIRDFVDTAQIDLLIPNNIWSNSCSPPASIALGQVVHDLGLPTIAHHHDFYWERIDGVALTCATAVEYADKYMPPRYPWIKHVVINSLAKRELALRKGIHATVVPNVFNFDSHPWKVDDYNHDFRRRIGLDENDVMILQATRIVPKKGIELAVDFVAALNHPRRRSLLKKHGLYDRRIFDDHNRIVLVLPGISRDEATGQYLKHLKQKIHSTGIEALFIEDLIDGHRRLNNGHKVYSLWDTYVYADFVTYPSLWEGWGNQLLEALRAKLPLMLFEYPVYRADIKQVGLQVVSLGSKILGEDNNGLVQVDERLIEDAADSAIELLTNPRRREDTVEHNYQLGQKHYSLRALQGMLKRLID